MAMHEQVEQLTPLMIESTLFSATQEITQQDSCSAPKACRSNRAASRTPLHIDHVPSTPPAISDNLFQEFSHG
jgi:hypothetical protein